jgi:basic amino acid/polyamine antiporter, APA family
MEFKKLFRRKSLEQILADTTANPHGELAKNLKLRDLVAMGIAAIVGAGVFSTIGKAAYNGGPGVVMLFIITAITCGFTAMCYAEFASRVPVAGSAYTYSYVAFGELPAWIIGWALILEYAIGNVVVAISWSSYFNNLLKGIGIHLPDWLTTGYNTAGKAYQEAIAAHQPVADLIWTKAPRILGDIPLIINLPAFVVVILITILAYIGIQESKRVANGMVVFKLIVLLVVIVVGCFYIKADNWIPFAPNGFKGIMSGVSAVFFAYIGFDAISTTAEECENPQRDMPKGMIYSLIICTILYILTALVLTGMVRYSEFKGVSDPLAYVFEKTNLKTLNYIISLSAVVATTGVLLVFQIGQPRIWMGISRDGLLPKQFASIHPKYKTPAFATVVTGFLVAIPSLFMDDVLVTDLSSIGTLFAFVLVSGGVLMLPKDDNPTKKFKMPYINGNFILPFLTSMFISYFWNDVVHVLTNFGKVDYKEYLFLIFVLLAMIITAYTVLKQWSLIPVLGVLCCLYLMIEIPVKSWAVFFGWMTLGLCVYFGYSFKRSKLVNTYGT